MDSLVWKQGGNANGRAIERTGFFLGGGGGHGAGYRLQNPFSLFFYKIKAKNLRYLKMSHRKLLSD